MENLRKSRKGKKIWLAVLVGAGAGSGKALWQFLAVSWATRWTNACL
jgi:hypothetical protein